MACGIDIGTSNLVAARYDSKENVIISYERNAFIYIGKWDRVKNKIKRTRISYTRLEDDVYILGTSAFDYANIFGEVELKRPMSLGMLNPKEKSALPIMRELIRSILGEPEHENEVCVYVTPSEPIDTGSHTVYHKDVTESIIESLGYKPVNIKESVALAYDSLIDDELTGIVASFGAGMCNVAVMYKSLTALDFSVTKSGDYIDENAARETDKPVAHVTALKESRDFCLTKTNSRETLALASYYRFVIKNILTQIAHLFNTSKGMPHFREPINIVCGGGTAMVSGFIELFKEEFDKLEFPINVKEIKVTEDPLFAVARGALSEAEIASEFLSEEQ
jgi:hypothetical protein